MPSTIKRTGGRDRARLLLWVTVGAVLLLVIVALVGSTIASRELQAARESHRQVERTREVLLNLQLVLSSLQDAETGERGYVITGNSEFLAPYSTAREIVGQHLERLDQTLTSEGARAELDELSVRAQELLAFLSRVIEVRRTEGREAAAELIAQEIGKEQMDRIRVLVEHIRLEEEAGLQARLTLFRARSARSEWIVRIALGSSILVTLLVGAIVIRHTHRRLAAEDKAREALDLLRATFDNITQGIAVFDARNRLLTFNDRYLELRQIERGTLGPLAPAEALATRGATLYTYGRPSEKKSIAAPELSIQGGELDLEATREDGLVLQFRARTMADGSKVLAMQDITELKASEHAYRDQATRLTSILDNIVDAIITINESGSIESWSKGAERLFGYRTEEVLRRNVKMLMPDPHRSAHDGYLQRYLTTGERRIIGTRREVEALTKDGRRLPVDLGISEMHLGSRRLFIGVVRDISERLEIERMKSGFVSTVSHELRTPLTSISGSLGLLAGGAAGALPAKASRLIEIAKLNCERLVRLINDILDLEKAESGLLDFRFTEQSILPIVQHAIESTRSFAASFEVALELAPDSTDCSVLVDRDRFEQVLTNLLSNAAKFSPRGGVVRIEVRAKTDHVTVRVIDEGPGIDPEFQKRIFQRFAQADSSDSRAKGGTGLGLSIAKTMMERLGGSIGFTSEVGRGTTFFVTLPVRGAETRPVADSTATLDGPSVLICEDDPDIAALLFEQLRAGGMRAETVATAQAALAAARAMRFDLALVDLNLPDRDGLDLITELRSRESTRHLPIVVMTASAHVPDAEKQVSALRVADWLQKPLDPQRLIESIHDALAMSSGRRARVLHVEDDVPLTQLICELLGAEYEVVAAHSLAQAREQLAQEPFDLAILDVALNDGSGLDILPNLDSMRTPVVLYSASETSQALTGRVQSALVKSRNSVDQLLEVVRTLTRAGTEAKDRGHDTGTTTAGPK